VRRSPSLYRLLRGFDSRLRRLEAIARDVERLQTPEADRSVGFVVIEALTTWANFSREFYLSCAVLHPKTVSGARVPPSFLDERAALLRAIHRLNRQKYPVAVRAPRITPHYEPSWHEKRVLSQMSKEVRLLQ
jgi:hypothetical protein